MGNIGETKSGDILKQYRLNFDTTYNVVRPVFVKMLEQGRGRIFMIGSRPGLDAKSSKGMIAYGLSKSLIFRLAELLNDEAKGKKRSHQCCRTEYDRYASKSIIHAR